MSDGSHAFLGQEFLTWLWYQIETNGGEFELSRDRIVGISLDDMLQFAPRDDGETSQLLRKGLPSRTPAARTALQNGQRLAKARLAMATSDREWMFTLDGATLGLGSIKLPEDDEELDSAQERSTERVANLLELHELLGDVYGLFLKERLADDYLTKGAEAQANWMAG